MNGSVRPALRPSSRPSALSRAGACACECALAVRALAYVSTLGLRLLPRRPTDNQMLPSWETRRHNRMGHASWPQRSKGCSRTAVSFASYHISMANGLTGWLRHTDGHPAVLYVGMSCSAAAYRLTWTSRTWPHRDAGRRNRSALRQGKLLLRAAQAACPRRHVRSHPSLRREGRLAGGLRLPPQPR